MLIQIIAGLLKLFLPALFKASKDTVEEAPRNRAKARRLISRVPTVLRRVSSGILLLAAGSMLMGCGTRVIYVSEMAPVRLRETVPNVRVWVELDGEVVKGRKDLPEGAYVVVDPGVEE